MVGWYLVVAGCLPEVSMSQNPVGMYAVLFCHSDFFSGGPFSPMFHGVTGLITWGLPLSSLGVTCCVWSCLDWQRMSAFFG